MPGPVGFRVTDHALLRWIERVERIGVEGLRMRFGSEMSDREMVHIVEQELNCDLQEVRDAIGALLFEADAPGDGPFELGGIRFQLVSGVVKTVMTATVSPRQRRAERRRARRREVKCAGYWKQGGRRYDLNWD